MAKKRKPKKEDKEQSQRFVETARDLEVDESEKTFGEALKRVAAPKKSK